MAKTKKNKSAKKALEDIKERYDRLAEDREPYLRRAETYSEISVPYIMPRIDNTGDTTLDTGHQSLTAEAVNVLASKFVMAMFPISTPFFSLGIDVNKISKTESKDLPAKEKTIRPFTMEIVKQAMRKFDEIKHRPIMIAYAKHLIVTGNSCLVYLEDGVKQLGLKNYVTKRDSCGRLIEGITKEELEISTLSDEMQAKAMAQVKDKDSECDDDTIEVYTQYKRKNKKKFVIRQFLGIDKVEDTEVDEHKLPVIFGVWTYVAGEDYGRGQVEDYASDFEMYEFLNEYRARGAATIMDVKFLVRAGSLTDVDTLNEAPSGSFVQGNKDDIVPLQLDKYPDTAFISEIVNEYKERISKAFLITTGIIRDSERTTAFEIDKVISELEEVKSGIYSSQVQDLQKPVANNLLDMLNSKFMELPLEVKIDSGLESLGKTNDIQKVRIYAELMSIPATLPQPLQKQWDMKGFSDFISERLYLDTAAFFTAATDQDSQEEESAALADEALARGIASGIGSGLGKNIAEGPL